MNLDKKGKCINLLFQVVLASACVLLTIGCDNVNSKSEVRSPHTNDPNPVSKKINTEVNEDFFFMQDLNKSFRNLNKPLIVASPLYSGSSSLN